MRKTVAIILALALAVSLAACGDDDDTDTSTATTAPAATDATEPAEEPDATEPAEEPDATEPADEPEAPEPDDDVTAVTMPDMPSQIDVAMILLGTKEEGWYATMIDSINRVGEANEYDLEINLDLIEEIAYADGERVIRNLAQSGEYEIILAHSTYVDAVQAVQDDFPDILFAYSGSGNDDHVGGTNAYWLDVFIHEPAYLAGIVAGSMTQTNKISAVAAFPFPNVNGPVNAFIDGARSVNPDIEVAGVAYIESWFDPATAAEAASAQIAAGSDMIYAERFGPFAPAEEAGNVWTFGHFTDQLDLSSTVLTSAVAHWDAAFTDALDAWYAYTTAGTPYDAPGERIVYQSMTQGGSALGRLNSDVIPEEVANAVSAAEISILNGELEIPLVTDKVE